MFFAMTWLLGVAAAATATQLPAQFMADRVYVVPVTRRGERLRLYTDTGGGLFLKASAMARLHLTTRPVTNPAMLQEIGTGAREAQLPPFAAGQGIPAPSLSGGWLPVAPAAFDGGQLPGLSADDGLLGQAWFAGRVWTWDYPHKRLLLEEANWHPASNAQRVALGFRTDAQGRRENNFPRIEIKVDGRTLPVLLDTGAMTVLTPAALKSLHDGLPAERATSMIVASIFDAWHKAHPDWRVVANAQAGTHSSMIEVPQVEIAGKTVGPVWFTERPDENFHQFMSGMMAGRVEGSIGGNALGHFAMTIDYPHATAYFRCVLACKPGP